ncbi:MarR family winged helix-turn-helix transcriptional regulator [Nocardia mexicana]|uniref:DNA-binding MarR family transcriptional regulator n=1 Tax=Nocardia mexicana TaxID=279262 RepID=A0A370GBH4_9NOCA|nr:MarR family transcriptional regulator [Nocardia mexicana]RDI41155.1 DNA-binding MarR family transcriptional regulator [Nocardia mexicana]
MSLETVDAAALSAAAARLRIASTVILRRSRRDSGECPWTPTQWAVLGRLHRYGAMAAVDLARLEMVRPQTMRNLVDGLRDQGLIAGVRDPTDGRRVNLMLTDQGRAWVLGQLAPQTDALAKALSDNVPTSELHKVLETLDLLERIAYG